MGIWNKTVIVGMKGYNEKVLKETGHTKSKIQLMDQLNTYVQNMVRKYNILKMITHPFFLQKKIKYIQKLSSKFLYKDQTVDNTTLHALNEISIAATGATIKIVKVLEYFSDYCA